MTKTLNAVDNDDDNDNSLQLQDNSNNDNSLQPDVNDNSNKDNSDDDNYGRQSETDFKWAFDEYYTTKTKNKLKIKSRFVKTDVVNEWISNNIIFGRFLSKRLGCILKGLDY